MNSCEYKIKLPSGENLIIPTTFYTLDVNDTNLNEKIDNY